MWRWVEWHDDVVAASHESSDLRPAKTEANMVVVCTLWDLERPPMPLDQK
jgi:hypothetical protein